MGATDGVRRRCRVVAGPNCDGATTLYGTDGRTYQVIDARDSVRERLDELSRGETVTVVLEPVRCRGDGWRIVRLGGPTRDGRPVSASTGRPATGLEP